MITQIIKYYSYSSGWFWLLEPPLRCFMSSSFPHRGDATSSPAVVSVWPGAGPFSAAPCSVPSKHLGWCQGTKHQSCWAQYRAALYHSLLWTTQTWRAKFTKGIHMPHLSWGTNLHEKEQLFWRWHLNCPASESLQSGHGSLQVRCCGLLHRQRKATTLHRADCSALISMKSGWLAQMHVLEAQENQPREQKQSLLASERHCRPRE